MSDEGGQSIWRMRRQLREIKPKDIPTILFYGDSHLTHLKRWMKVTCPTTGPKGLDKKIMKRAHYCAVGGSNFMNVDERVRGIKVPETQKWQGNQWRYTLNVKELNPTYILVSLGTNDCDSFDRKLKKKVREKQIAEEKPTRRNAHMLFWTVEKEWELTIKDLYDAIDEVLDRLKCAFPDSTIMILGLMTRSWWCNETVQMARNLDWWMKAGHNLKLAHMAGFVEPEKHLMDDGVHLTREGYRLFMDKILSRIYQMFLASYMQNQ